MIGSLRLTPAQRTVGARAGALLAAAMISGSGVAAAVVGLAAWLVAAHGYRGEAALLGLPYLVVVAATVALLVPLAAWARLRGILASVGVALAWIGGLAATVALRGPLSPGVADDGLGMFLARIDRGAVLDLDGLWTDAMIVTTLVAVPLGFAARVRREPAGGPLRRVLARTRAIAIGHVSDPELRIATALGSALAMAGVLGILTYLFVARGGMYGAPFDVGMRGDEPSVFGPAEVATTFSPTWFLANVVVTAIPLLMLGRWNGAHGVLAAAIGGLAWLQTLLALLNWAPGQALSPYGTFSGLPLAVAKPLVVPDRSALWLDVLFGAVLGTATLFGLSRVTSPPTRRVIRWVLAVASAIVFQLALSLVTLLAPAADLSFGAPLRAGTATPFALFTAARPLSVDVGGLLTNVAITAVVLGCIARWVGTYGALLAAAGSFIVPGLLVLSGVGLLPLPARSAVMPTVIWYDMLAGAAFVSAVWVAAWRIRAWYGRGIAVARTRADAS